MIPVFKVSGIGPAMATALSNNGIATAEQLAGTSPDVLLAIPRIGPSRVKTMMAAAHRAIADGGAHAPSDPVSRGKTGATAPGTNATKPAKTNQKKGSPTVRKQAAMDAEKLSAEKQAPKDKKKKKLKEHLSDTTLEKGAGAGKAEKTSATKKAKKKAKKKADKKKSVKKTEAKKTKKSTTAGKAEKVASKKKGKKAAGKK